MSIIFLNLFHLALCCSVLSMGFTAGGTGKNGLVEEQFKSNIINKTILHGSYLNTCLYRGGEDFTSGTSKYEDFHEVLKKSILDVHKTVNSISLKIDFVRNKSSFYFNMKCEDWIEFYTFTEEDYFSNRDAGGFVGTSIGIPTLIFEFSTYSAIIHNFIYNRDDVQLA